MKTTTRQTASRTPHAITRIAGTKGQLARRPGIVHRARAPDKPSDSRASLGKPAVASPTESGIPSPQELIEYPRDVFERSILFWDTLRKRANNMLEHERAGLPPLLDFEYETLLDARHFERPANYALLRITQVGDDCWEDCVDLDKPPVIVVDPRAGHGPGIGGFKHDSEVGMALHEGHPVYFVIFFPEPAAGQTLIDVLHALRRFVEDVAQRHPGKSARALRELPGRLGRDAVGR